MPIIVINPAAATFLPSGMTKSGSQAWGGSSWTDITGWTADTSGYPGSTITSNRLNVQGVKTNATLRAEVVFGSGIFSQTHTIRVVDQAGTLIGAQGSGVAANSGTCIVEVTNVDLTSITRVGVQMLLSSGSDGGTVTAGAGTFLHIT